MKQQFTLAFLLFSLNIFAQAPVNDDCSGLIDLGVAPACSENEFFTNVNATGSDIGFGNVPTCFNGGNVENDVWFAFTTSDTIFDYTITVTGLTDGSGSDPLENPQIALYRGDCQVDGLAELACVSADNGETMVELDVMGLTPNITYFIRINDYSPSATPNWGTFQLCVDEMSPANTIDEGGSMACSGELYDSGGPDGDYGNNENNTFSICPTDPHGCITFTLEYYNIETSDFLTTDQLLFFDGPEATPGTLITQLGGADFGVTDDGGGGAVCFEVQASSGCLTVQFISDGSNVFEGFAGAWQCTAAGCEDYDPLSVDENITEEDIVNAISTPLTSVTVTDINCPEGAYGVFDASGDNSELGLEKGLLLTSGDLDWAVGPNNDAGGGNLNANNNAPGDADLDYLSTVFGDGSESNDACVVEFDIIPATNEVTFEYIFGSDEYPEFVNQFNDIFAFLISGPGIVGDPNIGNQENIAVLPDGSNTLVEINSVNNLVNWEYYRNNENGQTTEYDGLTSDELGIKKSLTARAEVVPCSTYHLKLAVADRLDNVYDSGVFISELSGGVPQLGVNYVSGIEYLIEDCTSLPDEITISLSSPQEEDITYDVIVLGTAERDVDYVTDLPSSITFQAGETDFTFPITPLADMEIEPIETIQIALTNDFGCGEVTLDTLLIELHDELNIVINAGQDTVLVCQDTTVVLEVEGAASYFWTPIPVFDNPNSATPIADVDESQWVFVEGTVGPCVANDSVYLEVVDPMISLETVDPVAICRGDSVQITVVNNVDNANLTWTPTEGLSDLGPNPTATPFNSTDYIASVDVAGCVVSDTLSIDVAPFDFPGIANDTTICQNYSVQLGEFIDPDTTTTTYSWTPNLWLDNDTIPNPIATPQSTITYQLIATSGNEGCSDTAQVTITVLPADVTIQNPDTVEICLGESVDISAVTSVGDAEGLVWSPADGSLSDTLGLNVVATPTVSTLYTATYEVGACVVFDSIFIRVDSLPDLEIVADPEKDPYCQGETVIFSTTTYEPNSFPDIEHQWLEGLGYQSGDTLLNMVISTQDTFTYQRVTTNRGCIDTSEITINVVVIDPITIIPPNPEICPGESVQLEVQYSGQPGEITWSPETDLSCTNCLNPVASPSSTTSYVFMIDVDGCPASAQAQVIVTPDPLVQLNTNPEICLGDQVQLNFASDDISTYTWTSPDDPGFSSNDPELILTPTQTTTYLLTAQAQDCPAVEFTTTVFVVGPSDVTVPDDLSVCSGDSFTLLAEGTAPEGISETFFWEWPGGSFNGPELEINNIQQTTTYNLTYVYGPNCGTIMESVTVTVEEGVTITQMIVDPEEFLMDGIPLGEEITITAVTNPEELPGATYQWTANGEPVGTNSPILVHTPLDIEPVTYTLLVTNQFGCTAEASVGPIDVIEPQWEVPNIFTPNNDDVNDFFRVINVGQVNIVEFKIYNRWGQLVYDNLDPAGWDGMIDGKPAPSDVYVFRVAVRYANEFMPPPKQGDLTLLR